MMRSLSWKAIKKCDFYILNLHFEFVTLNDRHSRRNFHQRIGRGVVCETCQTLEILSPLSHLCTNVTHSTLPVGKMSSEFQL